MNNGRLAFFNLVKQMRQAQKDFYSTKGQDWQSVRKPLWDKSLALEKRVDEYIAHGDAYLQQHQPSLFDKEIKQLTKSNSLFLQTTPCTVF